MSHDLIAATENGSTVFMHDPEHGTVYCHNFDQKKTTQLVQNNVLLKDTPPPGACVYHDPTKQLLMGFQNCLAHGITNHEGVIIDCGEPTATVTKIHCGQTQTYGSSNNHVHAIDFNNENRVTQSSLCTQKSNIPFPFHCDQHTKQETFLVQKNHHNYLGGQGEFGFWLSPNDIRTFALHKKHPIAIFGYGCDPFENGNRCQLTMWDLSKDSLIGTIHPNKTATNHYDLCPLFSGKQVYFLHLHGFAEEPISVMSYTLTKNQGEYDIQDERQYISSLKQDRTLESHALEVCEIGSFLATVIAQPGDYHSSIPMPTGYASLDFFYQHSYCEELYVKALEKGSAAQQKMLLQLESFGTIPKVILQAYARKAIQQRSIN
jgi:hypothetical protein